MSKWLPIYGSRSRRKEDERWACAGGCDTVIDQPHSETPKNGICKCPSCVSNKVSDAYKVGYDEIDWSVWKSTFEYSTGRRGHKVGKIKNSGIDQG